MVVQKECTLSPLLYTTVLYYRTGEARFSFNSRKSKVLIVGGRSSGKEWKVAEGRGGFFKYVLRCMDSRQNER